MTNPSARFRLRTGTVLLSLLTVATFVANPSAQGQAGNGPAENHPSRFLWQHIPGNPPPTAANGTDPAVRARRFSALTLDRGGIIAQMAGAPREFSPAARRQPLVISLPTPGGGFERFAMQESPVMEPGLAARHPEIKTYSGRGIDDPAATIRADVTPLGFHASVRGSRGGWYIDPYYRRDDGLYVSYYGRDLESASEPLVEPGIAPPEITVDRGYYHPADDVQLKGAGFTPSVALVVTITGAHGSPSRVIDLQSDEYGAVHATFIADLFDDLGTHTVEATDGANVASGAYDVVSPDDQTVDPPSAISSGPIASHS